jgi:branched-chain amino acid transport system ATP-binding protein
MRSAARSRRKRVMLEIQNLTKTFGGLRAISDLTMTLERGQFLGVIGPNGAGKTTLLNLITGYHSATSGAITLDGQPVGGLRPFEACKLGIARTFQVVRPFVEMSVEDNVMTGAMFSNHQRVSVAEARKLAQKPMELVGLHTKRDLLAGALTLGERKKLELARALATQPKILLLDEVMAGIQRGEVDDLMDVLERIHEDGTTVLMIEHLVHVIVRLAQHVVVLNFGEKLFEGEPAAVLDHPGVQESYLGKPLEAA